MAIQFSVAVRNGMLDAIEAAMGLSARVQIFSGTVPANCASAATGVKLAEWALASDWAANATSGSKSLTSVPLSTTGLANGIAGYYRFTDSPTTTCHEQGTVTITGGGGDMTIDNTSIASGQTVQITGFTKTAPGA